jgi:hypothetical protein
MSAVGTELGKLIPSWLAKQTQGCGCNNWKQKLDDWGIEKCKSNRQVIIQRLVSQKNLLPKALQLLPRAALQLGASKLVDQAIANAEKTTDPP